jgi:hypothetical protein
MALRDTSLRSSNSDAIGGHADMRAPISHPEPGWGHCAPATAALESGAYAQRATGEQDAAIRTARNAPMRIEEHIDANE